jgi:SAM-dependent methyltransferase
VTDLKTQLSQGRWDELSFGFAPLVVLWSALKLEMFPALAASPRTAEELARALHCSGRGVRMVLDCLTAMGFLRKVGPRYRLNRLSRSYFLPSSDDYAGRVVLLCEPSLRLWLALPEVVRSGEPALALLSGEEKDRLQMEIADALFQVHRPKAWSLARLLSPRRFSQMTVQRNPRILDVAAGSAVWSIPFALKHPGAEVAAVDLSPVLEVAKKYARRFGLENRYRFIEADISKADLGRDEYDLALLGHICHSQGERGSRELIGKCFCALREKGTLLIMDFVPDERRKSALLPLLLAVHALLGSPEGDTFTRSQYGTWLSDAGFGSVRTLRVPGHSPVFLGFKRPGERRPKHAHR